MILVTHAAVVLYILSTDNTTIVMSQILHNLFNIRQFEICT